MREENQDFVFGFRLIRDYYESSTLLRSALPGGCAVAVAFRALFARCAAARTLRTGGIRARRRHADPHASRNGDATDAGATPAYVVIMMARRRHQ